MLSVNWIVFSLSTPSALLIEAIKDTEKNNYVTFCLSPHKLFDLEIKNIQGEVKKEIKFVSLYQFITQQEMAYCDRRADEVIVLKYGNREGNLINYFSEIKRIKNDIVLKKIENTFFLKLKYILCDDLGIDVNTWIVKGFSDYK